MMVTFISQCEKNALKKTRRVLDAFANRIGDNTWQTVITEEGLKTVKKMLRHTASKSTAVSCHWIRSRSRSQFLWVVGNKRKFDENGVVPVNRTAADLIHKKWEKGWHTTEIIAIISGIAGLFHDFGKANDLFQNKLNPTIKTKNSEPYRHEWVSLRLFQAFVGKCSDDQWLMNLGTIGSDDAKQMMKSVISDNPQSSDFNNPLEKLPPLANVIAWLIVSHHRLPVYPKHGDTEPSLSNIDEWAVEAFDPLWNSLNSANSDWSDDIRSNNWSFSKNFPCGSMTWMEKASQFSKRALRCLGLLEKDWFKQPFVMHISRLALMLSDHNYSAMDATLKWQDLKYHAYANTDKQKQLKQKLDEHNIGVAHHAYLISKLLPRFRDELPTLDDDEKILSRGLGGGKTFQWQDKAYQTAKNLQGDVKTKGFFGINMASTGKGKTIANARIMYGIADEDEGCRFSIALGLRTLTLQTGTSLKERLSIDEDEIATLIGSQAIQRLSQSASDDELSLFLSSSESQDIGLEDDGYDVIYETSTYEGHLEKWFPGNPKAKKLLHAPILVSTIDYLIPATEGVRGGRQIVPMLRLLTSDLILDEPDEFDLNDLPALARLVNWAGLLCANVLVSTATMPPALAYALFEAYQEGRQSYSTATNESESNNPIVCAWFDEFGATTSEAEGIQAFIKSHDHFVNKRITNLNREMVSLRKAEIINIKESTVTSPIDSIAETIKQNMLVLHSEHYQQHVSGKKISIGLVRMANINPLVAVSRNLYSTKAPENYEIHYCVYHSQYPLAQRALIESKLDYSLNRKDPSTLWRIPEVAKAIRSSNIENHLFVVLATSVAEIGRDHDYDWAIAEPSSMRSLIQLAGRIQRHRKQAPETANLYILSKNIRALQGKGIAYEKPGFEANNRRLFSHDLHDILNRDQFEHPNSIPSIQPRPLSQKDRTPPFSNLVTLEQVAYREKLLGDNQQENHARLWWKNEVTWCAELQRRQRFRQSSPDQAYCLYLNEEDMQPVWQIKNEHIYPTEYEESLDISNIDITVAEGIQPWFEMDILNQYDELAARFDRSLRYISRCFGEVRLREVKDKTIDWCYSPLLGIFEEL